MISLLQYIVSKLYIPFLYKKHTVGIYSSYDVVVTMDNTPFTTLVQTINGQLDELMLNTNDPTKVTWILSIKLMLFDMDICEKVRHHVERTSFMKSERLCSEPDCLKHGIVYVPLNNSDGEQWFCEDHST